MLQLTILITGMTVNVLLSLVVFKRNPGSATNRSFSALGFIVTVWLLASYLSTTPETNLLWSRLTIFCASLMTMLFFIFVHTMPYKSFQMSNKKIFFLSIVTGLVMIVTISPYAFVAIDNSQGAPQLIVGPGMAVFGALAASLSLAAVYVLWRKGRKLSGIEKQQTRFVLMGTLLMHGLLITTVMVPVAAFQNDVFVQFIPLYTLMFLGLSAYAIIRYRFLDIKAIIVRAVSFLIIISIGAATYALIIFVGIQSLFNISISFPFFVGAWGLTIVAMLTFQPMESRIRKFTNRIFYKGDYDSDQLLADLTQVMVETIDLNEMTGKILAIIEKRIKIEKVAFAIIDDHKISEIMGDGYSQLRGDSEVENLFHQYFLKKDHIVFDEMDEGPLKDLFRAKDILFAMPLRVQADEVAILVLGSKSSGEPYNSKDVNLLSLFGAEAGIAIQNAKAYKRIKEFSKELEKKVEERTSELKESQEKELAKAQEVAKLKDEFVFIAAHELRTPVTAIRGFLELVSESMGSFPKDVKHHLSSISDASEHLNQLINDLLQVSRSDAGTMTISTAPVEIEPVVKTIVKELSPMAGKKKVSINFKTETSKIKALTDGKKLGEVLMNILGNAVKYNKDGGLVDVSIYGLDKQVMIEIKDTGYGISQDQQDKIFQKFFRAGTKGTEDILGTGLGLFIAKMLVEKMGGKIQFSSVEGQGSTFGILLPMADLAGK